ncbi:MAG TPA: hypothetical protein VLV89_06650 [Candidatus Acidoferrum sp.]|nr:hypothetical protein [Candidatus Acidoferrum sp.]
MATKKKNRKKKSAGKKKSTKRVKPIRRKKMKRATKSVSRKAAFRGRRLRRGETPFDELGPPKRRGLGGGSAGQSGDTQGISRSEDVDSESAEELLEEGQSFEAEVVSGVENALDPDQGEVRTREVPEDDVPEEYTDKD